MIILDTNQLDSLAPPDGPVIAMLQTLAKQTGHSLGLPELVLDEHLAHYRRDVHLANARRITGTRELRRLVRYLPVDPAPFNPAEAVRDRTERLQRVFLILRTPDWAAREALIREARRELPAKTALDGAGSGGRDAAIWLTAIAECIERGEDVYFVATDKAAFGEQELKPELDAEVRRRLQARHEAFHYCYGVDALLGQLATIHPGTPSLEEIAASPAVQAAMKDALRSPGL